MMNRHAGVTCTEHSRFILYYKLQRTLCNFQVPAADRTKMTRSYLHQMMITILCVFYIVWLLEAHQMNHISTEDQIRDGCLTLYVGPLKFAPQHSD